MCWEMLFNLITQFYICLYIKRIIYAAALQTCSRETGHIYNAKTNLNDARRLNYDLVYSTVYGKVIIVFIKINTSMKYKTYI